VELERAEQLLQHAAALRAAIGVVVEAAQLLELVIAGGAAVLVDGHQSILIGSNVQSRTLDIPKIRWH